MLKQIEASDMALQAIKNLRRKEKDAEVITHYLRLEAMIQSDTLSYSNQLLYICLLYTSPSPRDKRQSRMPSSA